MIEFVATLAFLAISVHGDTIPNLQPFAPGFDKNRTAVLLQNSVKGNDAKNNDYALERKKGEADLHLARGSKNFETNAAGSRADAKAANGKTGVGTKIGSGGTYETQKHKGDYRTSQQGSNKTVDMNSNGRMKLNVKDVGKEQDFVATGNRHNWETDPNDGNFKQGILKNDGKPYDYTINKSPEGKSEATLEDKSQKSIFVGTKKYKCVGQKDGISNCADEFGRKVGEVRGNKAGDVVVTNSLGIPIHSAKAVKDKDGKPMVQVNNGLFNADSGVQKEYACPGFTNSKVKISKPLGFKYQNAKTSDGGTRYDWPNCFDCSATITLGAGILGKNMAFKWIPLVLPIGRLNCQDPATIACGGPTGQCYYCDMCDPVKRAKVKLMSNAQSNICEAKGGDTFTTTATICPPPDAKMVDYCDHFSKGIGDPYWAKKGNMDVTFEVYNRKTDADFAAIKKDWRKYNEIVTAFKKANTQYILSFSPPEDVVRNWYKGAYAEKIGCRQSIVNYNLGGSKANTALLFEAAGASSAFGKNPCPAPKG